MDKKIIMSYTSADAFPVKVCRHGPFLEQIVKKRKIIPVHVQWAPTNRCNHTCSFCSCQKRTQRLEADYAKSLNGIKKLCRLGMRAVTITGGGEPLLYPKINELINEFAGRDVEVGLVSNGFLLKRLTPTVMKRLKWCRISCSDEQPFINIKSALEWAIRKAPRVDWSFSYVLTSKLNKRNLIRVIQYANENNFTHVRIVSDLLNTDRTPSFEAIKAILKGIDDSRIIYQGRKEYSKGSKFCYISLLKPLIGPDLKVYPCCGVQYARKKAMLDLPPYMQMGDVDALEKIYKEQKYFNGGTCDRCYYDAYNKFIGLMLSELKHHHFL